MDRNGWCAKICRDLKVVWSQSEVPSSVTSQNTMESRKGKWGSGLPRSSLQLCDFEKVINFDESCRQNGEILAPAS